MIVRPWIVALLLPASSACAQTAFDTFFTPTPSSFIYNMRAGNGASIDRLAWRFTAQASGVVDDVTVAAYRASGTGTSTLTLLAANGTQVGATLGTVPFTLANAINSPPVVVDASALSVTLNQGQDYWLSLNVSGTTEADWVIYGFGPPNVGGPQAYTMNGGPWLYFQDPQAYYPAFRITVPEPASMGAMFLLLGFTARHRRA
jgi:hypothetical protein